MSLPTRIYASFLPRWLARFATRVHAEVRQQPVEQVLPPQVALRRLAEVRRQVLVRRKVQAVVMPDEDTEVRVARW